MKRVCSAAEYRAAIDAHGGIHALTVLSSYTFIDDPGTTPFGPGTHVYTEWGTRDGVFVAEAERHNDDLTLRIADERERP